MCPDGDVNQLNAAAPMPLQLQAFCADGNGCGIRCDGRTGFVCARTTAGVGATFAAFQAAKNEVVRLTGSASCPAGFGQGQWNEFVTDGLDPKALAGILLWDQAEFLAGNTACSRRGKTRRIPPSHPRGRLYSATEGSRLIFCGASERALFVRACRFGKVGESPPCFLDPIAESWRFVDEPETVREKRRQCASLDLAAICAFVARLQAQHPEALSRFQRDGLPVYRYTFSPLRSVRSQLEVAFHLDSSQCLDVRGRDVDTSG